MVKEAYCSFEVAKWLKEKGFNWRTQYVYTLDGTGSMPPKIGNLRAKSDIQKPTHQMAMAWLREVHNIQIELNWDKGNKLYSFQIWKLGKYQPEISSLDLWRIYKDDNYLGEWNYEETVEAALKYCLENLI